MSSTKKTLYIISAACLVFMFAFLGLFVDNRLDQCLFLGVLFMTVSYHVIIRLVAGTFCDGALEKGIDTENHWFADNYAEQSLYRALGVKRWKNRLSMPDAWKFSIKKRSLEDVIAETCRTELVHEIGIAASLLSVLLTIPFGYMWFFILTAVLGVLFDLSFIVVMRCIRPRMARTAAEKRLRFFEKLEYDNAFAEMEDTENNAAAGSDAAVIIEEAASSGEDGAEEENDL